MKDSRREEREPLVINQSTHPSDGYGSSPPVVSSVDSLAVKIADSTTSQHFDYVLVLPHTPPASTSMSKQDIIHRLLLAGLITEEIASASAIFVKIRADIPRLQKEAARVKLPVLVDEAKLEEVAKSGLQAFHIDPFEVENPPRHWIDTFKRPIYAPYQFIYMPYAKEMDQSLYASHQGTFFSTIHRMQLIESILTNVNGGGAGLDLEHLISDGVLIACFPLHNAPQKDALSAKWMAWCYAPWQQPLPDIRNYFGPKVALYFAFLGHYTTYALWAALVGLVFTAMQLAPTKEVSWYIAPSHLTYALPVFGVATMFWASFFLKHWKRRNAVLAMEWGMSDFDKESNDVKLFHNRPNTWTQWFFRIYGSWLVVLILLGGIIGVVAAVARGYEEFTSTLLHDANVLAIVIVGQIFAVTMLFETLCIRLTDFENHPTETSYENSFVAKLVIVELVNHFAALSYLCFFVAIEPDVFTWLVYRVYGAYIVLDHAQKIIFRPSTKISAIGDADGDMEKQFALHEYGWKQGMLDHLKITLHFAYVTFFAVLCPLNPFLSFVHYSLELRLNGRKMLQFCRRPRPRGAENLGAWYIVLHWILNFAICSNAFLMVVIHPDQTLKKIPQVTQSIADLNSTTPIPTVITVTSHQIVLSLILCMVVCRVLISIGYQDTPSRIRLQLQRQAYYVAKLYYKAFGWPAHAELSKEKSDATFEYCLAFPNPEGLDSSLDKTAMASTLEILKKANVQYKVYPSEVKSSPYLASYIFCEVRATEAQLQAEAARIQLPMLLDEIMLKEKAHEGIFRALHEGMVDIVDRLRIEATRVNLLLLLENMLTQPAVLNNEHGASNMADKVERLLATIESREPRHRVSLDRVLSELKDFIDVDFEGEQFRSLDMPQTILNRIETFLRTGEASGKKPGALDRASIKSLDRLIEQTFASLHEEALNSLCIAQTEWKFGLEKVLWVMEEVLKQSDVSALELVSPDSSLKWLNIQEYLSNFDSETLYPKLSHLLVECMSLLEVQGSTPYKAFQEFRAKHPQSIVLDMVAALETSIIANPDIEIHPFYLGNPDPQYNLLAKRFKYAPYLYLHMPYHRQLGKWQEVYATPSPHSSFTPVQRVKLIESLLQRHIDLDSLVAKHVVAAVYPLHDSAEHESLKKEWVSWTLAQPLGRVNSYLGENVAMYFAHLGHATKWLTLATAVGVVFSVWQTVYGFGSLQLVCVPAFGVFMILWATLWLKYWTRTQTILQFKWGLNVSETKRPSHVRAEYIGDFVRNPITGQKVKYFKRNARLVRWVLGWLIFASFVAIALGGQALIFYIALKHTTIEYISLGTAFAQGVWILFMKLVFNRFSIWLIDFENHRTDASYETAFVLKAGLFHAVNSYASLLFLLEDPLLRNRNSLYVIYGVELVASHVTSVLHLFLQSKGSTTEAQFYQQDYNWAHSMERHLDVVIHFGYMIGGVVVCPLAPVLAFLDHVLAMRLQAAQLLGSSRRPRPRKVTGSWYITMMHVVLVSSIITNSYLVVFVVKTFGPASVFSTFDGFCGVLLSLVALRQFFNMIINDVPTRIDSQTQRQQFVVESILRDQSIATASMAAVVSSGPQLRPTSVSLQSDFSVISEDDDFEQAQEVEEEGFV
ncbi:unnamed protein product [Aphanomyces euteiches]